MNPEICNKCERRPDVYVVMSINNGVATLNGIRNGGKPVCICHTSHPKAVEELEDNLLENIFKNVFIKPEALHRKEIEIDEQCPYVVEQVLKGEKVHGKA